MDSSDYFTNKNRQHTQLVTWWKARDCSDTIMTSELVYVSMGHFCGVQCWTKVGKDWPAGSRHLQLRWNPDSLNWNFWQLPPESDSAGSRIFSCSHLNSPSQKLFAFRILKRLFFTRMFQANELFSNYRKAIWWSWICCCIVLANC